MRKISKVLSLLLVFAMIVPGLAQAAPANGEEVVTRLAGAGRWETAAEISKEAFEDGSEYVVIASGRDFGDALAGSSLAAAYDAPILLTKAEELPEATVKEIGRLDAKKVIILGGETVVNEEVEEALVDLGLEVEFRLGGANRYDTAALIAEKVLAKTNAKTAVVVSGSAYADGMAVGAYAGLKGYPVLYVREGSVAPETAEALKAVNNVLLVGGTAVINKSVENELKKDYYVEALRGDHRVTTALAIAEKFDKPAKAIVANGYDFADALVASVLGAKNNAPVLLVKADKVRDAVVNFLDKDEVKEAYLIGGINSVNAKVEKEVREVLEELVVETVEAITTIIEKADKQQLEIQVNGDRKVTVADLNKAGYDVDFLFNKTGVAFNKATGEVDGTNNDAAEFKYAVKVTPEEGDAVTSAWTTVKVVNVDETLKVTKLGLTVDDAEWKLDYLTMTEEGKTIKIVAKEAVTVGGKEVSNPTPSIESVTSTDERVAFYGDNGLVLLKPGKTTLTVKFDGVIETTKLTLEVKAAQKATSVEENGKTLKIEAGEATDVEFTVLDQYGEKLRPGTDKVDVKVGSATEEEITLAASVGTLEDQDLAKGTHRVVVKLEGTQIGAFNIQAIEITNENKIDQYQLVFADSEKTQLEINPVDNDALGKLDLTAEAYIKGIKVDLDRNEGLSLTAKSSDKNIADIDINSLNIDGTIEVEAKKEGTATVTLYTVEGDLEVKVASINVVVKNTTPQITTLKVEDDAQKGKIKVSSDTAEDVKTLVAGQLTTGDEDLDGKLESQIIEYAKYSKNDGKVVVKLNDNFGGLVKVFDVVVE